MPRFTTSDGLSLHYTAEGAGPPVLCLAGLTRNADDFAYLARALPEYRLIRLDYRGRGRSDRAADFESYTVEREGQDAIELLDHLDLGTVPLIGTSRGGLIGMTLAQSNGDRLSAIVLNDIGPVIEHEGLANIMTYLGRRPDLPDLEAGAQHLMEVNADTFPGVPLERWREEAAARWTETPDGLDLRYDPRLRDALEQGSGSGLYDPWVAIGGLIERPVGIIRGENSDILSEATVTEMVARIPDSRAVTLADRGHVPFLDEPEAVDLIRSTLESA
ncbi:alpha/beta fold hydrolase [Pelagovum pacificum]|uniref:Alpha/beta hydrolase n=1 Tax=Pelagovum pacificum TaxID=2588711 RepID=A0A5C5GHH6_9RHOB|nr:alpha/beta hydrolase [Pelagovum pacificum]QQA43484.1 alpha/beta hydrolase [Pelagovum pacificum]TNY33379.1 alpha/beta hydrolase [Pelagovum pacificum]